MENAPFKQRKIIHVDMDCFYAAIEMRDDPSLRGRPVAVGGGANTRGVLCTCNYEARKYGLHSAMATALALKKCPNLVLLPVNMEKYKSVSQSIRSIMDQYSEEIEPISLDEAFLDVSQSNHYQGSATWIARAICEEIYDVEHITASAGVAPNKFLAKIASDWRKPNGMFVVTPPAIDAFVNKLPVKKIMGVGKVTEQKLHRLGLYTCGDIRGKSPQFLSQHFGIFGDRLHALSFGKDTRPVCANRTRKSLSVEHTFSQDLQGYNHCMQELDNLYERLLLRLRKVQGKNIAKQFVKVKFFDFSSTTVERLSTKLDFDRYKMLILEGLQRHKRPVRLLGLGVRFQSEEHPQAERQLDLFNDTM